MHHFDYIARQLEGRGALIVDDPQEEPLSTADLGPSKVVVYRTRSNEGYFTYDGIDVCGARLASEVQTVIDAVNANDGLRVAKISIVGYSLGGLITRYAIGLLYKRGLFDEIEPVTYTSFCSPHLGVAVLGSAFRARAFNWVGTHSMSSTSRQLFLRDTFEQSGVPLLLYMSDKSSPFYKGLEKFSERTLYANILNDHRCEFYTSAISGVDPYVGRALQLSGPFVDGYEPIVLDIDGKIELDERQPDSRPSLLQRALKVAIGVVKVAVIVPAWFVAFLLNAAYQGVVSSSRIRSFKQTRSHIVDLDELDSEGDTRGIDTLLHDEGTDVVETVFSMVGSDSETKQLNLPPAQTAIAARLNSLGWNKFPVRITLTGHSHAAAIVRFQNPLFAEGETVVRHWLDTYFPSDAMA